jgi:hypothetical protein
MLRFRLRTLLIAVAVVAAAVCAICFWKPLAAPLAPVVLIESRMEGETERQARAMALNHIKELAPTTGTWVGDEVDFDQELHLWRIVVRKANDPGTAWAVWINDDFELVSIKGGKGFTEEIWPKAIDARAPKRSFGIPSSPAVNLHTHCSPTTPKRRIRN